MVTFLTVISLFRLLSFSISIVSGAASNVANCYNLHVKPSQALSQAGGMVPYINKLEE